MGMNLPLQTQGFRNAENHTWLGSAHGTENPSSGTLDADSWLAIFTDGEVPSGVVLMRKGGGGGDADLLVPRNVVEEGTEGVVKITVASSGNTTVGYQGVLAPATALTADGPGAFALLALLNNLPDIDPGDFTVEAGGGGDAGKLIVTAEAGGNWEDRPLGVFTATGTGASVAQTTAGVAGTGTAVGHLLNMTEILDGDQPVSVMWHGRVIVANLPANSGWDADLPKLLPNIAYQV